MRFYPDAAPSARGVSLAGERVDPVAYARRQGVSFPAEFIPANRLGRSDLGHYGVRQIRVAECVESGRDSVPRVKAPADHYDHRYRPQFERIERPIAKRIATGSAARSDLCAAAQ